MPYLLTMVMEPVGAPGDLTHGLNAAIPCGVPQLMSHSEMQTLPPRSSDRRSRDPLDTSVQRVFC